VEPVNRHAPCYGEASSFLNIWLFLILMRSVFHLFSLERVFEWMRVFLSYLRRALALSLLKVDVCELSTMKVGVVGCAMYHFASSDIVKHPSELQVQPVIFLVWVFHVNSCVHLCCCITLILVR